MDAADDIKWKFNEQLAHDGPMLQFLTNNMTNR